MLLVAGILLTIIAVVVLAMLFFANMQSTTGAPIYPWWPAWAIFAAAAACFVARHYLHGVPLTW